MNLEKEEVQKMLQSQVKEYKTTLEFENVWENYHAGYEKKRNIRITKIRGGAACFIFLIIVTPVGANVWTKWHNITVKDMDQEAFTELQADSTPRLDLEAYPDYLNTYPQVSLDEAMEMASFEILRPKDFQMPTEISTGTLENKGFKKIEFGAYWDVFREEDKWIYVRQDVYDHSEQVLDEDAIETVWRIPPGIWISREQVWKCCWKALFLV